MRFLSLSGIAGNCALMAGLAVMAILPVQAQNSNTGNSSMRMANANVVIANTPRAESTSTPRSESTVRTETKTVTERETSFPWGLLGLLGLAGLMPKKRSIEVAEVRDTRETRTTTDTRDNRDNM